MNFLERISRTNRGIPVLCAKPYQPSSNQLKREKQACGQASFYLEVGIACCSLGVHAVKEVSSLVYCLYSAVGGRPTTLQSVARHLEESAYSSDFQNDVYNCGSEIDLPRPYE